MTADADEQDDVAARLMDLLVYAPIGLVLDAEALAPDLARRGRQHCAAARQIGELTVKLGIKRLDEVVAQVAEPSESGPDQDESDKNEHSEAPRTSEDRLDRSAAEPTTSSQAAIPAASSSDLAIVDYDLLAASQVVKRLAALAPEELEAVRLYEATTRDRRTILHKITRLQSDQLTE